MFNQATLSHPSGDVAGHGILLGLLSSLQVAAPDETASALLSEFGSLSRILGAGAPAQMRVVGKQRQVHRGLGLVREAMLHSLSQELAAMPLLDNRQAVINYLHVALAFEPREQIRVLFLDVSHRLIHDEVICHGSVASATIHPREIMRRALEVGAMGLVMAHNHPSGNPEPSRADIQITRSIVNAARALEIQVHDHIVIASGGHTSMRSVGLM